jgi:hypothetical protein
MLGEVPAASYAIRTLLGRVTEFTWRVALRLGFGQTDWDLALAEGTAPRSVVLLAGLRDVSRHIIDQRLGTDLQAKPSDRSSDDQFFYTKHHAHMVPPWACFVPRTPLHCAHCEECADNGPGSSRSRNSPTPRPFNQRLASCLTELHPSPSSSGVRCQAHDARLHPLAPSSPSSSRP